MRKRILCAGWRHHRWQEIRAGARVKPLACPLAFGTDGRTWWAIVRLR